MARILGHSEVRRELQKLASRSARIYAAAVTDKPKRQAQLEAAYQQGFRDGIETADKINHTRGQA